MKRILKVGMTLVGGLALALAVANLSFAQEADMEETVTGLAAGIDTVWLLISAMVVFFMQAGFAMLEAGSSRSKNAINIMMKNLMDFAFATVSYLAIGYAFMFGPGTSLIGLNHFLLADAVVEGEVVSVSMAFWFFQLVFAGTAATIVSGAVAERTKFPAYIIFSIVITAFIYPIAGSWVWRGEGWLAQLGFLDFAGSTVVHSLGGWAALMGAILVGPRIGRFSKEGKPLNIPGHSAPLAGLGVFILWIGWFGFNAGSQLAAAGSENAEAIAMIAANTTIAAAAGAIGAIVWTWVFQSKPSMAHSFNGVIGGLVAITAPCAFVTPIQSVIIGLVGGVLVVLGMRWLEMLKIDDPVGAVPAHLVAGVWGTLAVGLFPFSTTQVIAQLIGIGAYAVWGAGTSYILFAIIKSTIGLRVSAEEEERGLDFDEHGAVAYPDLNPEPEPTTSASSSSGVSRAPAK
jgi:Amt family ammonium transporter